MKQSKLRWRALNTETDIKRITVDEMLLSTITNRFSRVDLLGELPGRCT